MDATEDSEEHSVIWLMLMSSTLQASVFMVKNYSVNWHSIKNTEDLTTNQMFDKSEKLISEQSDEIHGVKTINWENSSWKHLSLMGQRPKVYVFSDSVLCLGKVNQNPTSNTVWEEQLGWFRDSPQYKTLDTIDVEPMESEWNIFPGISTLELVREVPQFMSKMCEPEQFQGRIIFMSMFNDIIFGNKDNETECLANSTLVSLFAKRFPA